MTSTSPAFLQAGEDLKRCSERPCMCVHARVHVRVVWDGSRAQWANWVWTLQFRKCSRIQESRTLPSSMHFGILTVSPRHHGNKWCGSRGHCCPVLLHPPRPSAQGSTANSGPSSSPGKTN